MSLVHKDDRRAYQQRRLDGDGVGLANPRQHEVYAPKRPEREAAVMISWVAQFVSESELSSSPPPLAFYP